MNVIGFFIVVLLTVNLTRILDKLSGSFKLAFYHPLSSTLWTAHTLAVIICGLSELSVSFADNRYWVVDSRINYFAVVVLTSMH